MEWSRLPTADLLVSSRSATRAVAVCLGSTCVEWITRPDHTADFDGYLCRGEAMAGERGKEEAGEGIGSVLERITDGIVAYDRKWRFTYLNRRMERYFGRPREYLLGKSIWEEFPAAVNSLYYRELHRAVAEQRTIAFAMPAALSRRWYDVTTYPAADGLSVYLRDVTAQRAAEESVQTSEACYRIIFESSADGILLGAPDGAIHAANPAACAMLDYTEEELCRRGRQGIADMADAGWEEALAERDREGRCRAVLTFVRKDGSKFVAEVTSAIFHDEQGNRRSCAVVKDLTAAWSSRRRRGKQEARFRRFIEAAPEGIWTTDENGTTDYVNHRIAEMLGYQPEELKDRLLSNMPVDHEDRAAIDHLLRPREAEWIEVVECRLRRSDGSELWALVTATPLSSNTGEFLGTLTTIADITERKRTEQSWGFLSEASRALVRHLDDDARLQNMARLLVPRLADICVVDLLEGGESRRAATAHEGSADPLVTALMEDDVAKVLRTGVPALLPEVHDERVKSAMLVPLMLEGQPVGVLSFVSLRAGRRYGQADLALALSIADWAATAIEHGRLYRKALEACQMRDEVLRVVSHDLRDPLHNIGIAAQLILMSAEHSRTRKHLARIQRSVSTAHRLIEDLLDIARIEVGKLTVDRQSHDAAVIINEAIELVHAFSEQKSLQVVVDLSPHLPAIFADFHRLLQVFANLLGNAVKYASDGGWIRVAAAHDGELVRFSIEDNGPGIAKECLPHVFDRFWQANAQRPVGAGLGLGLAIAKAIVEVHGGAIWVESEEGKGATFRFTCPVSACRSATG
jgi:PAS domain S-box-containing protein